MSDKCSSCDKFKKNCSCLKCGRGACDRELPSTSNKVFCRKCDVVLCDTCAALDTVCSTCSQLQEYHSRLWKDISQNTNITKDDPVAVPETAGPFYDMVTAVRDLSTTTLRNLLLQHGNMYVELTDKDGWTLLHHAIGVGDVDIAQFLVDKGADVNVELGGMSLLHRLADQPGLPRLGQICEVLFKGGINTFRQNKARQTALTMAMLSDNFELQTLLEPVMFKETTLVLERCLTELPDLPDDVTACFRYLLSKLKSINPFQHNNKLSRNKSVKYRSIKDKGIQQIITETGCDPYKLKKTVTDNNAKIVKLKEELENLRDELISISVDHREELRRFEQMIKENRVKKAKELQTLKDHYDNEVSILGADLAEAERLREDSVQALNDVLVLKKKYKLCWVPKSLTGKCGSPDCKKLFRDGYSQHHCRCCGRVFCFYCSIQRVPVPVYGYEYPVRVCAHCYTLLNEEVLCDFDETNIDIDQWNSVHLQNESNTHNLGRSHSFLDKYVRSRSSSTSTSVSRGGMSVSSEESCSQGDTSCTGYDSESTLSNNSDHEPECDMKLDSTITFSNWKNMNIKNLFKNNPLSRNNSFKRKTPSSSISNTSPSH